MKTHAGTLPVVVRDIEQVTPLINVYRLEDPEGRPLPGFSGGSHVVVLIPSEGRVYRNPYSLMGTPFDTSSYLIGVRRQDNGRGGSRAMHNDVKVGTVLHITHPANNFPVDKLACRHIFIAGGVGLTPMIAQIRDLQVGNTPYELHYAVQDEAHAGLLAYVPESSLGQVRLYRNSANELLDAATILSEQPLGSHVYLCGPAGMIEQTIDVARQLGWADSHIHWEEFTEQAVGEAFTVTLARSGTQINVSPELSLLEAAEQAGIDVPYLCRGGACGHCETEVLEFDGEIVHRDIWLSDEEKSLNRKIMPCVSRARCTKLVLDL